MFFIYSRQTYICMCVPKFANPFGIRSRRRESSHCTLLLCETIVLCFFISFDGKRKFFSYQTGQSFVMLMRMVKWSHLEFVKVIFSYEKIHCLSTSKQPWLIADCQYLLRLHHKLDVKLWLQNILSGI